MARKPEKSTMRHLGEFFGEVWKGIKTDPCAQGDLPHPRRGATG